MKNSGTWFVPLPHLCVRFSTKIHHSEK
uniref:Uncharacterized protein n=1 Tax=Arundo donax TaxID=35708 RepID=A0A0A8XVM1_ARUDO